MHVNKKWIDLENLLNILKDILDENALQQTEIGIKDINNINGNK